MVNETIGRVSKGTKMDQVYLPKLREGLELGEYVVITSLNNQLTKLKKEKPFLYHIKEIESLKLQIIDKIFSIINKSVKDYNNIIITGSFLEKGFYFNDIDLLIITDEKINEDQIKKDIWGKLGLNGDFLVLDNKSLIHGLNSDPLYSMMLSKCISKKRLIYKIKKEVNYKLLDLHLLKSKTLLDSFEILSGKEKYYLTRNLISIKLFLENKKLSNEIVNHEIEKELKVSVNNIKENIIQSKEFIKNYKIIYNLLFEKIMDG